MKTYAMISAGLLVCSLSAAGQDLKQTDKPDAPAYGTLYSYQPSYLQRAAVNYAVALHSDCDGVVESAIIHSTLLRILAQDLDMSQIRSALAGLVDDGRTPAIRYRAFLATAVFDNPAKFENAGRSLYASSDQFFSVVASQAHNSLLGHNMK
jgi:hypothetical protein